MPGRPYKVWSSDKTLKKAVVADSLKTLLEKGCQLLSLEGNVKVVLEEDGTEVDDEEYFQFLGDQTTFMFLSDGEKWQHHHIGSGGTGLHAPDSHGAEDVEMDYVDCGRLTQLVCRIRSDVTSIVTFTSEDMQLVATEDTKPLATLLNKNEKETLDIQNMCQRYLDDRQEAKEAIGLLNLVQQVQRQQSSDISKDGRADSGGDNKRQRLE